MSSESWRAEAGRVRAGRGAAAGGARAFLNSEYSISPLPLTSKCTNAWKTSEAEQPLRTRSCFRCITTRESSRAAHTSAKLVPTIVSGIAIITCDATGASVGDAGDAGDVGDAGWIGAWACAVCSPDR